MSTIMHQYVTDPGLFSVTFFFGAMIWLEVRAIRRNLEEDEDEHIPSDRGT